MWVRGGCRGVFTCNNVANVTCDPCDGTPNATDCGANVTHICSCNASETIASAAASGTVAPDPPVINGERIDADGTPHPGRAKPPSREALGLYGRTWDEHRFASCHNTNAHKYRFLHHTASLAACEAACGADEQCKQVRADQDNGAHSKRSAALSSWCLELGFGYATTRSPLRTTSEPHQKTSAELTELTPIAHLERCMFCCDKQVEFDHSSPGMWCAL